MVSFFNDPLDTLLLRGFGCGCAAVGVFCMRKIGDTDQGKIIALIQLNTRMQETKLSIEKDKTIAHNLTMVKQKV